MSLLYKGQSLFTISLETGIDTLASASVKKILYKKPSGATGEWTAVVNGTKLIYDVQANDIDESGTWQLQAFIVIDGRTGYGQITTQQISQPLN